MKFPFQSIAPFCFLFCFTGCTQAQPVSKEQYIASIESAKQSLPVAVEFEKQFENVDHFVVHFGFHGSGQYEWQSTGFLHDRYKVTMIVNVDLDLDKEQIKPASVPKFMVNEITEIEKLPDGRFIASFGDQFEFDSETWEKFCKQENQEFDLIGMKKVDRPIVLIDQYIEKVRKPRIPITLTENKEQTIEENANKEQKEKIQENNK